jgi:hypothetical protein
MRGPQGRAVAEMRQPAAAFARRSEPAYNALRYPFCSGCVFRRAQSSQAIARSGRSHEFSASFTQRSRSILQDEAIFNAG